MRAYLYSTLRRYLGLFILPHNSAVEIDPNTPLLVGSMPGGCVSFRDARVPDGFNPSTVIPTDAIRDHRPDYLVLSGLIHYERDIQGLLATVHDMCHEETRLLLTYYSTLWRPLTLLASVLRLRRQVPPANWLAHEDVENLLRLERFEIVHRDSKILLPIPVVGQLVNRWLAPLPVLRNFCLLNIVVARPLECDSGRGAPSVSIVVPARNEAGNIERIVERIPKMGPDDEIIFIEGHSTDNTWDVIQAVEARYRHTRRITIARQDGKGKGDAVRKGFALARNDILMILDADMTVPPEDLPKFYRAIKDGQCEFANGSRLVYPMEARAMRFINLIGNKFFATAFSFVLGQRFKDTLCGTKVLHRTRYERLASNRSYFGNFDPFGDFDLIFGAARMGLKIVEIPITYRDRVYGATNIARWRHGALLLAMLTFAARRIKFL